MSYMTNAPNDPRWDHAMLFQQDESFRHKKEILCTLQWSIMSKKFYKQKYFSLDAARNEQGFGGGGDS
jgi:hypothetical protein